MLVVVSTSFQELLWWNPPVPAGSVINLLVEPTGLRNAYYVLGAYHAEQQIRARHGQRSDEHQLMEQYRAYNASLQAPCHQSTPEQPPTN